MKYSFLRASVLILVAVCSSFAQTEQSSSAATTQTADAAIRAKALNQLQALAGQLGSLQSAENRARIGSNIVGSLWKHDEQRARTLLRAVEEDIKLGLQNAEAAEPRDVPTLMVFLRLRTDTIERVAKHDAELALEFLKSTTLISDKPLPYNVESEQALELRLAKQIAADNPDRRNICVV